MGIGGHVRVLLAAALGLAGCRPSDPAAPGDAATEARMARERERMMRVDIEGRGVRDPAVLAAMRAVPRHEFVPEDLLESAYADHPLPIGSGQTISQPYIVAAMTEFLQPAPHHVVLEVGTGSGYQAAVLARVVRHVYSIEILPELGERARRRLERLGVGNVTVRVGDGYRGWPEQAPFDGILVTCAPDHVPAPLVEQLRPGGRMVIPVGGEYAVQELVVLTKEADGSLSRERVMPVRFVPMLRDRDAGIPPR